MSRGEFAEQIRNLRITLGWNHARVARALKINHATAVRWERGESEPPAITRAAVLDILQKLVLLLDEGSALNG
jgi:transcriptional regulator with XRE-family HTH domain